MQKPYDKNKVGKFIGWGGEHLVYEYDSDQVIKFSLHVWLSGKKAVDKIIADYAVGKKYFGNYVLDKEVLTWREGGRCAEIQPKIECRFLHKDDLRNRLIKEQFDDIIERYRHLERTVGSVVDLFGREGFFSLQPQKISNILVTPERSLILIDFTLMELKQLKLRELPIWLFIMWAKRRQQKLLQNFIHYYPTNYE